MSKFKVGDWVVRSKMVDKGSAHICRTGRPVKIVFIDKSCLEFSEEEGGYGWLESYFREATGEDFEEYQMTLPSVYKTERTLEDVKLDLANKLDEVERLKKELEELENPVISVSIPKKHIESFVMYWNGLTSPVTPTNYIYNILKESLEQHNAKAAP